MKRLVDSEVNTLNTRIEKIDSASKTGALRDEGNVSLTSDNGWFDKDCRQVHRFTIRRKFALGYQMQQ